MSVILTMRCVDGQTLLELLDYPENIYWFLDGSDRPARGLKALKKFFSKRAPRPAWIAPSPDEEIDIDKAWHAIHFMLTRSAYGGTGPQSFLLAGGQEIGEDGTALRALLPEETGQFSTALMTITVDYLRTRFDIAGMLEHDIYLAKALQSDPETGFAYVVENFELLRGFVTKASEANKGLLIRVA